MHYNDTQALDLCASILSLQPGQQLLDIGSGFNSTGRYLASKYGVSVTGVEYQGKIHELAEAITGRNEDENVRKTVKSVHGNWLELKKSDLGGAEEDHFDGVVSFLCILHMGKEERPRVFQQAAKFLKPGGKLYIEDYFLKSSRDTSEEQMLETRRLLKEIVDCPWLPTEDDYVSDVSRAGFTDIEFRDVSEEWFPLLRERAEAYRSAMDCEEGLQVFYDTVAGLFEGGVLRGVRLTATKG